MKKITVYVAGPMRGHPLFNYPAFDLMTAKLEGLGFRVINPAQMDRDAGGIEPANMVVPEGFDWMSVPPDKNGNAVSLRDVFLRDTQAICTEVDMIVLLPGWEKSKGACAEVALAKALGLPVLSSIAGVQ